MSSISWLAFHNLLSRFAASKESSTLHAQTEERIQSPKRDQRQVRGIGAQALRASSATASLSAPIDPHASCSEAHAGHSLTLSARINAIDACFRQRLGVLEARRRSTLRGLLSPIVLHVGAVRAIMRAPFVMLDAAGLVNDDNPKAGSPLRWLAGIGSLALPVIAVTKALRDMGWVAF